MKKTIAASILGNENKKETINKLLENGIEWIHYDIMDGYFVSNRSLPLKEVKYLFKNTNKHYKDVHLMVHKPSKYIKKLIKEVDQFSIHVESNFKNSIEKIINKYYKLVKIGLVINPSTKIEEVIPFLNKVHHIMIMSVVPGKGGQKFIENSIQKIEELKKIILKKKLNVLIEIDGGINDIWGPKVFEKGVDIVVSGSYLINNLENNAIKKILDN